MSTVAIRFRPGLQTSTATDPAAQRTAIGAALDQRNIRVQLAPGRVLTGAQLVALPPSQLVALGFNVADVWSLLDDAALDENRGQIVDLHARDIGQRFGLIDRLDGNYDTSQVTSPRGTVSIAEISTPAATGAFSHRQWYHYLYEWLFELFSGGAYESHIWNEPDRQVAVGRQMFDRAPASVSAMLTNDVSRAQFRDYLLTQRPSNLSAGDWQDVVDNMLQGMTERRDANATTIARADVLPSIPARDAYLVAYLGTQDGALRTRLDALRDVAATMPTSEAETLLSPLEGTPAARDVLLDMVDTLRAMPAIVRNQAAAVIAELTPATAVEFRALVNSAEYEAVELTDMDRREALRLWAIPALRSEVGAFLHMMVSPQWQSLSALGKQRLIQLAMTIGTADDLRELSHMWVSLPAPGAGTPDRREAILDILAAHPEYVCECVDRLPFIAALARHDEAIREDFIRRFNADPTHDIQAWTAIASIDFPPEATPLSNVLYGSGTLDPGSSGHSVVILQRYLQALRAEDPITRMEIPRYPGLGNAQRPTYDAATEATVRAFQHDNHLPETGRLDRNTLIVLMRALPNQTGVAIDRPGSFHYLTTMNLNAPTASTDGWWPVTRHWRDPGIRQLWRQFAQAYMREQIDSGIHIDCADLFIQTTIVFARQMGLPVEFTDGTRTVTHNSRGIPISATAMRYITAAGLRINTVPVMDTPIPSDFFSLDWDQSLDGKDSAYNHTAPVDQFDPAVPGNTFLIYGSLSDYIEPSAAQAYSTRYGLTPVLHDVSEYNIIDAINPDPASEDRRRPPEVYRPRIATLLRQYGIATPTEAMIDDFVVMVRQHTLRDGPTVVETASGQSAFDWATGRDLWADSGLMTAARNAFNTQYHVNVTIAQMQGINRKGTNEEALEEARRIVATFTAIAADQREAAARMLLDGCNGSRRARRLPFDRWDSRYP